MLNDHLSRLSRLGRTSKVVIQYLFDVAFIVLSFLLAMLLRLESAAFMDKREVWAAFFVTLIVMLLAFRTDGLYRNLVRFLSEKILLIAAKGALLAAIMLYMSGLAFDAELPRSVPFIFATFVFLFIGGLRFIARAVLRVPRGINKTPVIIYGAGDAGAQLLHSLSQDLAYAPIALVDDDPKLKDLMVGGLKVFPVEHITRLVSETGAQVILLAMPNISRIRRAEIVFSLQNMNLNVKTIPSLSDIVSGKAKISELRALVPEDLLGRDPVAPIPELMGRNVTGRVVMISGAGGSIGSELSRQALSQNPSVLVLYEMSEIALYSIEAELSEAVLRSQCRTRVLAILGSVQDRRSLEAVIKTFKVQTIYHAAAYKHVPLVEENMVVGIRNNVFGTLAMASVAQNLGVENFILISTDKAVRPTNVMGATKRIAELICQAYAREASSTVFSMVRFGNVLGSSGSVIPRFRDQIAAGGPVTVTHKGVTRYFMTIQEAAQLVIQAGALGQGGDVFVLDMGEPVKIIDLAFNMVRLHGLTPYLVDHPDQISLDKGDIPIMVTGLRKGEKLYEELLIGNNPTQTRHSRIMTASELSVSLNALEAVLDRLLEACEAFDLPAILAILHELPLDYAPATKEIFDLLWDGEQYVDGRPNMDVGESVRE